jgi:hypothetical protein
MDPPERSQITAAGGKDSLLERYAPGGARATALEADA